MVKILEFIDKKAGEKFAILTAEDLIEEVGQNLTESEMFNFFNDLKIKGFIRLKYNDGKSFCCMMTDKGKNFLEKTTIDGESKNKDKTPYFLIFLSAFLGGILGGLISTLIFFRGNL